MQLFARHRRLPRGPAWLAGVAVAALVASQLALPASAGTQNTVVTMDVATVTNMSAALCAPNTPATTFGTHLPGVSTVTTADCTVEFGSNNSTAMLKISQRDSSGSAMFRSSIGELDTSFNSNGKVLTGFGSTIGTDQAYGVATQSDGKVVVGGYAHNAATSRYEFAVARYNANGSLDTTFSADGKATVEPLVGYASYAYAVLLQPDGKVVLAGTTNVASGYTDIALARFNADGTLDTSFDGDGRAVASVDSGYDYIYGAALEADGSIVVAGGNANVTVARFTTTGSLQSSVVPSTAPSDHARAVLLQSDRKIVVAGGSGSDFMVMRFNPDLTLDTTFDADGIQTTVMGTGSSVAYGVAIQDGGEIVAAGQTNTTPDFAVARYTTAGALDASFDTDGKVITPILAAGDIGRAVKVEPDGKIVVAGHANNGTNEDGALVRYTATGSLDTSFGSTGKMTVANGNANDVIYAMELQADGRTVVAGYGDPSTRGLFSTIQFKSEKLSDFNATTANWTTAGTSLFGGCLRAVSGAGVTGAWTVDADAACTAVNTDPWNHVPTTSGAAGAKVAASTSSGLTTGSASLRFGLRTPNSQLPGRYYAPLAFEVLAPNA